MTLLSAFIAAVLFACGTYLILHRDFIKILFGFSILTHATNVFVLVISGEPSDKSSPIVSGLAENYVDPLPQALILTAIVIGFGVTAYLVVLLYRLYADNDSTDAEEIYHKKT